MKKTTCTEIADLAVQAGFRCDYSGLYIPPGSSGVTEINTLVQLACAKQRDEITRLILNNARMCSGITRDILLSQIAAIELLEFPPSTGDDDGHKDSSGNC